MDKALEFSKAFDLVSHHNFFQNLDNMALVVELVFGLPKRMAVTCVDRRRVIILLQRDAGVPQGSGSLYVLGPRLFLLYTPIAQFQ